MFDTEKFISEIEKRPMLYDIKSKEYSNKILKNTQWEEIGKVMYDNWNGKSTGERNSIVKDLQVKWKSLRDKFKREVNELHRPKGGQVAKRKKKYIYFDQLLFLQTHFQKSRIAPNSEENEESKVHPNDNCQPEEEDTSILKLIATPPLNLHKRKKKTETNDSEVAAKLTDILTKSVNLQKSEKEDDVMGNRTFLLSLLPTLNALSLEQSMYTRFKIMKLMHKLGTSNFQPTYSMPPTCSAVEPRPLSRMSSTKECSSPLTVSSDESQSSNVEIFSN